MFFCTTVYTLCSATLVLSLAHWRAVMRRLLGRAE